MPALCFVSSCFTTATNARNSTCLNPPRSSSSVFPIPKVCHTLTPLQKQKSFRPLIKLTQSQWHMNLVPKNSALSKSSRRSIVYALSFSLLLVACFLALRPSATLNPDSNRQPAPVHSVTVIQSHPHDKHAFTQGLCVADPDHLYESTGKYGLSTARIVNIETGIAKTVTKLLDDEFGEGVSVVKFKSCPKLVIQVLWKTGHGYVYDSKSLKKLSSFDLNRDVWGLAVNNEKNQFYISDGTSKLHVYNVQITSDNYNIIPHYVNSITVTDGSKKAGLLNELEFVGNELWANVLMTKFIARINVDSAKVISWLDLRHVLRTEDVPFGHQVDVMNGIAYHPTKDLIYVTGKYWPKMYAIRPNLNDIVEEGGVSKLENAFFLDSSKVDYILKYVIG